MSVTIYPTRPGTGSRYPKQAVQRSCDACVRGYCQPGWCEDGIETEHVPTAPEVNYANTNARALLLAVGLDPGEYLTGAIDAAEVVSTLAEVEAALRDDGQGLLLRSGMVRAPEQMTARVLVCGSDDARARERLRELATMLRWAAANGSGVAWS